MYLLSTSKITPTTKQIVCESFFVLIIVNVYNMLEIKEISVVNFSQRLFRRKQHWRLKCETIMTKNLFMNFSMMSQKYLIGNF